MNLTDHVKLSPVPEYGLTKVCKTCDGYGGWNIATNVNPLPHGEEDTPRNRRVYCHVRKNCPNCWGWGYTAE